MSRRFIVRSKPEAVAKQFNATITGDFISGKVFAPRDIVPIIVDSRKTKTRELQAAHFGLVPSFAMDPAVGKKLYSCRAETIDIKPSFRPAFEARRCLIPASAFYEWHLHNKEPFEVTPAKGKLMALAGLWDRWRDPVTDEVIVSCCIITTEAAGPLAEIEQRMPVILDEKAQEAWLNAKSKPEELKALLKPYAAIEIAASEAVMAA